MESRIPAVNVAGILDKTIKMVIDEAPNAWRKLLLSAVAWLTSSGKTSTKASDIAGENTRAFPIIPIFTQNVLHLNSMVSGMILLPGAIANALKSDN